MQLELLKETEPIGCPWSYVSEDLLWEMTHRVIGAEKAPDLWQQLESQEVNSVTQGSLKAQYRGPPVSEAGEDGCLSGRRRICCCWPFSSVEACSMWTLLCSGCFLFAVQILMLTSRNTFTDTSSVFYLQPGYPFIQSNEHIKLTIFKQQQRKLMFFDCTTRVLLVYYNDRKWLLSDVWLRREQKGRAEVTVIWTKLTHRNATRTTVFVSLK